MEKSTKNILIATGAGLAAGAIAGILFAPAKGSETRANIGGKITSIKDQVIESKTSTEDLISNIKNAIGEKLKNSKAEVKDELLEQINKLENSLN